jgi:CRISPR/Cas system CSM-associated protein Csm3 (group 7 of RAMP superfamily)
MSDRLLDDAMDGRSLAARWVIRGTLTLTSAMHLGAAVQDRVDSPVLCDPRSGAPLLPGTTLAGALRNALADWLAGYGKEEPSAVAELFGGARTIDARGTDAGVQSPLVIFDALGTLPKDYGVEIRDGVAIAAKTGVAEDGKKYDFEVLPAGTRFAVRVDLLVPKLGDRESDLLGWLAVALEAFSAGHNGLGARRSRGLGRVRAVWTAQRFDLTSERGWLDYALSPHEQPIAEGMHLSDIRKAIEAVARSLGTTLTEIPDARSRVVIALRLRLVHDLLIRSSGTQAGDAEVTHLHSAGKAIVAGTSLAGVLRAQALRIATLVREDRGDAEPWINRLFGPRFTGRRPLPGHRVASSRLRVGEGVLEGSEHVRQTRVAIDRFTHGPVDGALFIEQPEIGGHTEVELELRDPCKGELGLMLLVVKDLLDGLVPVGGSSSIGRGMLSGSATVSWHPEVPAPSVQLEPGKAPTGAHAVRIDQAIEAFAHAATIGSENP